MDDESIQRVAELGDLRAESLRLRQKAARPSDRLEVIAERAWARADELVDGVLRVVQAPHLGTCCGALARSLWEDMVTLEYVKKSPDARILQLLASALEHARRLAASEWGREAQMRGLGDGEKKFLKQRRKAEEQALRQLKEKTPNATVHALSLDERALLPSIAQRAREVGAHDQYQVSYAMESAGAIHFGLMALFEPPGGDEGRLLRALVLAVGAYRALLSIVLICLHMEADSDRLMAPLRERFFSSS
jgi:Family of unknown function (DUF5677)